MFFLWMSSQNKTTSIKTTITEKICVVCRWILLKILSASFLSQFWSKLVVVPLVQSAQTTMGTFPFGNILGLKRFLDKDVCNYFSSFPKCWEWSDGDGINGCNTWWTLFEDNIALLLAIIRCSIKWFKMRPQLIIVPCTSFTSYCLPSPHAHAHCMLTRLFFLLSARETWLLHRMSVASGWLGCEES